MQSALEAAPKAEPPTEDSNFGCRVDAARRRSALQEAPDPDGPYRKPKSLFKRLGQDWNTARMRNLNDQQVEIVVDGDRYIVNVR